MSCRTRVEPTTKKRASSLRTKSVIMSFSRQSIGDADNSTRRRLSSSKVRPCHHFPMIGWTLHPVHMSRGYFYCPPRCVPSITARSTCSTRLLALTGYKTGSKARGSACVTRRTTLVRRDQSQDFREGQVTALAWVEGKLCGPRRFLRSRWLAGTALYWRGTEFGFTSLRLECLCPSYRLNLRLRAVYRAVSQAA